MTLDITRGSDAKIVIGATVRGPQQSPTLSGLKAKQKKVIGKIHKNAASASMHHQPIKAVLNHRVQTKTLPWDCF